MHIIPMQINYKLSLSAREVAEIVRAAKEWKMTPQRAIEAILREWSTQIREDREKHLRYLQHR